MPLLVTSPVASDWLKSEEPSYRSRSTVIIAAGSGKLLSGQVLGKVGAKFVPNAATGSDGSQISAAILLFPVDATLADIQAVVVDCDAVVSHAGLIHGPSVNDATKRAAANAQLAAVGIKVRQGA
jgi:hypothetical protein